MFETMNFGALKMSKGLDFFLIVYLVAVHRWFPLATIL